MLFFWWSGVDNICTSNTNQTYKLRNVLDSKILRLQLGSRRKQLMNGDAPHLPEYIDESIASLRRILNDTAFVKLIFTQDNSSIKVRPLQFSEYCRSITISFFHQKSRTEG
jgi:hypothetical protein